MDIWGAISCLAGGRGEEPGGRNVARHEDASPNRTRFRVWLEGGVENLLTPPTCLFGHVGGVLC